MIVSPHHEKLDDLIKNQKEKAVLDIKTALERLDVSLYSSINHSIYRVIKIVERTILTTAGEVVFKRRYYKNLKTKKYFYLLDQTIDLPKYTRFSNEFRIKILQLTNCLNYHDIGELVNEVNPLSKSSVYRIIKTTEVTADNPNNFTIEGRIHLQIDEKYITRYFKNNKGRYKSKRRRYTATIFCGIDKTKKKHKLLNRILISSNTLPDLKRKIEFYLTNFYKVTPETLIYLSGDLASYIRNYADEITVCKALYIPDRWHICKDLRKSIGKHVNAKTVLKIISLIKKGEIEFKETDEITKILKLEEEIPDVYKRWDLEDYIGCSQECMNSHYYTPRFARCPCRWSAETLNKIALAIECKANNWNLIVNPLNRKIDSKENALVKELDVSKIGEYKTIYDKAFTGPTRKMLQDWTHVEVSF